MNGYFQLIIDKAGELKLHLFMPKDGGEAIRVNEVANYLNKENVIFDLKALNAAITEMTADTELNLGAQPLIPVSERVSIEFSSDMMQATARFYPASTGGREYTMDDIQSELRVAKIHFGVQEDVINQFLAEKKYCTDYVIAIGQPVVEGSDAVITYHFNTERKIQPTLNDDGSVDFFNLNAVNHVSAGDKLATLTPEVKGQEGYDVLGNVLKPRDVKRATLQFGLNITLNENGTEITSDVDGHASYYNGKVFVSNVYEVENVDTATGNITYEGNVVVNGNVRTNFMIKAKGDVEVKGVVEGATIISGGNIIIHKGVNGMGRGNLAAKGNIISKFIENTMVVSEGSVISDSILHSKVIASQDVVVENKKGFIIGGSVTANNMIKARNLGSTMGADTKINVGVSDEVMKRVHDVQDEMDMLNKSLENAQPALDAIKQKVKAGVKILPNQLKEFTELGEMVKQQQEQLQKDKAEIDVLKAKIEAAGSAVVQCMGTAYPGVIIQISDVSMLIKESFKYCKFVRQGGNVKMQPL